jgi:hypothetical protein
MRKEGIMKRLLPILLCIVALLVVAALAPDVNAWETYSVSDGMGNCADCHGDFRARPYRRNNVEVWSSGLHDIHKNVILSGDCDACHSGSTRSIVFLNFSRGSKGLAISCVGCHGREEDNTPNNPDVLYGISSGFGAGLRQQHWTAGETSCEECHNDSNPATYTSVGENVTPPYYSSSDPDHPNIPSDPCNLDASEDFSGDGIGLDNEGDGLSDAADPDCQSATPRDIDVSPLSLDFGAVTTGITETRTASITNVGDTDLTVNSSLNGAAPATPFTVVPGGKEDVSVDYIPSNEGSDSGTLEIDSNDPDETLVSVALAGTGVPPAPVCDIDVNPLALDFGSVDVGTTATLSIVIGNTGTGDCTVDGSTLTGSSDFALTPPVPTIPRTVSPGAAVIIPVDYSPTNEGGDSGTLEINSDDLDEGLVSVSRVTKRVSLSKGKGTINIKLVIKNNGNPAIKDISVVGTQNSVEVFSWTRENINIPTGRNVFDFEYTPSSQGNITWSATIQNNVPAADDIATATTNVLP